VGLAETNSILYFFLKVVLDPYLESNLIILVKYSFQNEILKQIFKKPGPAISMLLNSLKFDNRMFF
tara:strand:- start:458 stop:655 length:198 start_codon:yes stop_codon:yes gene_type:complete